MGFDPELHHRRSIRLKEYDYSQVGMYFVTICTSDKKCFLGDVVREKVELSTVGGIASKYWHEIPEHFMNINLDVFIVMPNHIHGIIFIAEQDRRGVIYNAPTPASNNYSAISPRRGTLSTVVRTYKSAVSRWCGQNGYTYFGWQRNYHEHIIRNEQDLEQIREYIVNNPLKWDLDDENPAAARTETTKGRYI
jgi:REP element-mobilizing transposase RayT